MKTGGSFGPGRRKTCIVTGGAGTRGFASARALLSEGAKVMLVDLNAEKLAGAVRSLDTDSAAFVVADVADAVQTREYVGETVARWGKIDVLFSNAGNEGPLVAVTDYPEDVFDSIMATHVRGSFLACKYAIPQMSDHGSIIIVSSITGVRGAAQSIKFNVLHMLARIFDFTPPAVSS